MLPIEIYSFINGDGNITKYVFNPSKLENEGEGPVPLERLIETPLDDEIAGPTTSSRQPEDGVEFFRYLAKDGADVRYQFDKGSRNNKGYVVAIHRDPENWGKLRQEDLAVANEEEIERRYLAGGVARIKRRDSVLGTEGVPDANAMEQD
jgi:hypothetical protein